MGVRRENMVKGMRVLLPVLLLCLVSACVATDHPKPRVAFYFWRTDFTLKAGERQVLEQDTATRLYLRYFDLVYDDDALAVLPLAPVRTREQVPQPVVPVVFIKNKVWEHTDSLALDTLAGRVLQLCGSISRSMAVLPEALQIDCDWTAGTAAKYFRFLRLLKHKMTGAPGLYSFAPGALLSATIRLHQVKYSGRQGIPPVDRGMLMYYNMGKIGPGTGNSIYEEATGLSYIRTLKKYPLPLDFALPVFAWGIHIREGRVVALLNKMDGRDFKSDKRFIAAGTDRYRAAVSFFKNGFYFKAADEVKVEAIQEADLLQMARTLKKYYEHPVRELVFYDLDSINISRYEKDIFKKVADRL